MSYLMKSPTAKKSPQTEPIPGREKDMSRNNAGGFSFRADSFSRMERFLILGSEGGTYYVGESDLTQQSLHNVRACIQEDGLRAVQMIVDVSVGGRAPKNDPALYALALAASFGGDIKVRDAALSVLPKVARIGTHLFQFWVVGSFESDPLLTGPDFRAAKALSEWDNEAWPINQIGFCQSRRLLPSFWLLSISRWIKQIFTL